MYQSKKTSKKKFGGLCWWSRVRFCASTAEGSGSIPGQGTKIPPVMWKGQKIKNNDRILKNTT